MLASSISPESLHPSLWRGSQLARGGPRTIDTGFASLSAELPGGGWPVGALVELLAAQPGCGEMRLLAPRSRSRSARGVRSRWSRRPMRRMRARWPPSACRPMRCCGCARAAVPTRCGPPSRRSRRAAAGALLLWQDARPDALRRLHLAAARTGDTLFVMLRAVGRAAAVAGRAARRAASGAGRRVARHRQASRARAQRTLALQLPSPIVESRYARLARHPSAAPAARRVRPAAV
jgi:protein ImuA